MTKRSYGKGVIHWGGELSSSPPLYPPYDLTAALLRDMGVTEDFTASAPVRYGHRRMEDREIYFVSNKTSAPVHADCRFRVGRGGPLLWDPVTGEQRPLPQFERVGGVTRVPLEFAANQSFFVVFEAGNQTPDTGNQNGGKNFTELKMAQELSGAWEVAFDPQWGGPEKSEAGDRKTENCGLSAEGGKEGTVVFDQLVDWITRPEPGIKYYSGIATYRKNFSYQLAVSGNQLSPGVSRSRLYLDLGIVHDMARVRLNGKDLGVVWCAPWRVEVTSAIQDGDNKLEIEVANRWANRLIGDKQPGNANVRTVACPPGFLGDKKFQAGRYTFSTHDPYKAQSPLVPSGLLGPVTILAAGR